MIERSLLRWPPKQVGAIGEVAREELLRKLYALVDEPYINEFEATGQCAEFKRLVNDYRRRKEI